MSNKQNTRSYGELYKKLAIAYKSGKLTAQQYKTIKGQLIAGDVGGAVRDAWIPAPASVSGSLGGTIQREYRPYADLRFMFGDSGYHYRRAGVRQSVETYKIRSGHVVRAERG